MYIQLPLEKYPGYKTLDKNDAIFEHIKKDVEFLTMDIYRELVMNDGYCLLAFDTWAEVEDHYRRVHGDDSSNKNLSPYCYAYAATYTADGTECNHNT